MNEINSLQEIAFGWFFDLRTRVCWIWLLEFLVVATLIGGMSWWPRHPGRGRQFLFDSGLSIFNLIATQPLVIWLDTKIVGLFVLTSTLPPQQQSCPFWLAALLPVGFFIAIELPYTLVHITSHKIPWLWRLHRIHHSAQSLTPATFGRTHPLELAMNLTAVAIGGRLYHIFVIKVLGFYPSTLSFHGLSWFEILLYSYENFRHSELWISFGPLNYFLSSPALHQIHHSADARHQNKNFSLFLSVWDIVFGTLYVPSKREKLTFGLSE